MLVSDAFAYELKQLVENLGQLHSLRSAVAATSGIVGSVVEQPLCLAH